MLDIDHGTYPFVTSSNAISAGACTGSGVPPTRIDSVIAILKAYTTRVGEGPFPTELHDDSGEFLRKTGAEFGTTTGRPRRCGWLDVVIGRYATRINGVTDFVITKLDVLTGLPKVPICVAYDVDGVRRDHRAVSARTELRPMTEQPEQPEHTETAAPLDWVSRLADEVLAEASHRGLNEKIVCASGISPSGPIHLGNFRELITPHLVADEITRRGIDCEHLLSWDDFDRFRRVPKGLPGVDDSWEAYIGMPLSSVPPPAGSQHASWAEHFKAPLLEAMTATGIVVREISQTEQYRAGAYRVERGYGELTIDVAAARRAAARAEVDDPVGQVDHI